VPPAAAVIGGSLTLYLAVTRPDTLVRKDCFKDGVTMVCGDEARRISRPPRARTPPSRNHDRRRHACFHCGEPIPRGLVIHASISGRDEPVCCHGCKAVAEFITGAGLATITVTATRAAAVPTRRRGRTAGPLRRPELVERLTRAEPNGARSITVLLEGLRCAACSWLADKALSLQSGVLDVSVNPATARARLVWIRPGSGSATCCACSSTSGCVPTRSPASRPSSWRCSSDAAP